MKNGTDSLIAAIADAAARPQREACTLPPSAYTSEDLFEIEKREILAKEWFCIGRDTDFSAAGDYLAFEHADEPLITWRGKGGALRTFSNVCRHRASILRPQGCGNAKVISCPYHAWTYNDDGTLRGAPHTGEGFEKQGIRLPEFQTETWGGFVFVNLNVNSEPLAPRMRGIESLIGGVRIEEFKYSIRCGARDVKANWKAMIENGLDGYHVFAVHKQTLAPNISRTQSPEGGLGWSVSKEPRGEPWQAYPDDPDSLTDELRRLTYTFAVFPTLLFSVDCHSLVWFANFPVSNGEAVLSTGAAARSPDRLRAIGGTEGLDEEAFAKWNWSLLEEDFAVMENHHRGCRSRFAQQGSLVPELEDNLIDFHRYLSRRLVPSAINGGMGA